MKRKTVLSMLLMVVSLGLHAQQNQQVIDELEKKIDSFCKYIEIIGTTDAASMQEKTRIRVEEVPELFVKFPERYMKTTGSDGKEKKPKKMSDYLMSLQNQSRKRLDKRIEYELKFQLHGPGSEEWTFHKKHSDGAKEFHSWAMIYQTYTVHTLKGVEVIRSYKEIDKKKMRIIKIEYPNGDTDFGLGDITRAEQMKKQ